MYRTRQETYPRWTMNTTLVPPDSQLSPVSTEDGNFDAWNAWNETLARISG